MLAGRGETAFIARWDRVLMIHWEVDSEALQRVVPFPVELREGRAFVSLVAFTMRGMAPARAGRLGAFLFRPIATHEFLNVRTYVREHDEPGIYFLSEWLSNRIAVQLGPVAFGLPYRHGRLDYTHAWEEGDLHGRVMDSHTGASLEYRASLDAPVSFQPCETETREEWLMERYTAFTERHGRRRLFRVWHEPWAQTPATVDVTCRTLLTENWSWMKEARLAGASFCPGLGGVWMGRPRPLPV